MFAQSSHSQECRYKVRRSSGILDAIDLARFFSERELSYAQVSRGRFLGNLSEAWVEGMYLYQEMLTQSVFQAGAPHPDSACIAVFAKLSGEARWFGQEITLDDVMFVNAGGEVMLSTPRECTLLVLCVPQNLFAESELDKATHLVRDREIAQSLRNMIQNGLFSLMNKPLHFARESVRFQLRADIQDWIDKYLAFGERGSNQICISRANRVVRSAIGCMKDNQDKIMSVDEICQMVHTSRRNLQKCFERVTGESPGLFLKNLRLNNVRQDILASFGTRLIGDIAAQQGFWHLSQFSVDYKRLFGESPSDTALYARRRLIINGRS